jgi:predicted ATPase/DNA-binding winged helix-turn-helix (wHTH) protein
MTASTTNSDGTSTSGPDEVLAFERYRLHVRRRILLEHGQPIRLGSRALAILIVLAREAGRIVPKRELQKRVWQNVFIEDGTLRVHVSALQRLLGESESGGRYLENVPGHGYRLVVAVTRLTEAEAAAPPASAPATATALWSPPRASSVPAMSRIIGRRQIIARIAESLMERRLVTLTGAAGGGKTTVAVGVAETSAAEYPQGIFFVDLASVAEPGLVSRTLASSLGIAAMTTDPLPEILAYLKDRAALVVLDNCEHVVEVAAQLTQAMLAQASRVRILATSREPLEVPGEWVHRVAPLEVPAQESSARGAQLLAYSAVQLFVERARAASDIEFDDASLRMAADLCRRLGGNPLAIEITAARVDLLGLQGLVASLDQGLHLAIGGSRVASPRHRTLRKTLDWSYELLPPAEQVIFRRLAVFSSSFDLESATAVVEESPARTGDVFEFLFQLASKSLIVVDTTGEKILYRMLEIPRAYALARLRESGELNATRARHTRMWCTIGAAAVYAQIRGGADWTALFNRCLEDLRAAIQWAFSSAAHTPVDSKLRLFSLWFEFVLAAECAGWQRWKPIAMQLTLAAGDSAGRLAAVLDEMPQHIKGPIRVLTVADQIGASGEHSERATLWSLWVEHLVKRDFRIAINISEAFQDHNSPHEPAPMLDELLAVTHHYAGRLELARRHAERALANSLHTDSRPEELPRECHIRAILARTFWLQGFPDAAMAAARRSVQAGQACGNAQLRGMSLLVAIALASAFGYQKERDSLLAALREHAHRNAIEYYQLWVACLDAIDTKGTIPAEHLESPWVSPDPLESSQYVDVLAAVGEHLVSPDTIVRAEHGRGGWLTAEVLRVKADRMLLARGAAAFDEAEAILQFALRTARAQGALAWEIKVATSLARLWSAREYNIEAYELLSSVYSRYTEGFQTTDLVKTADLMRQLRPS